MSHYKPYPAYKESGVEWIGQVPEHWGVKPIYSVASLRNGFPFKAELFRKEGAKSNRILRIRDISGDDEAIYSDEPSPKMAEIKSGDILIGMDGDFNVHLWERGNAKLNQRMCAVNGNTNEISYFLSHSVAIPLKMVNDLAYATTVKHLSSYEVLHTRVPIPPQEELKFINQTLNRETTRIDTLISKKTRFIELLKEKRQALITQAVTKGLDPNVKMKDSGVEWIGEVPEHWQVARIKRHAKIRTERRNDISSGVIYIGLEDVESKSGKYKPISRNSRQSEDSTVGVFYKDDVLYSKLRPYLRKSIVTKMDGTCSTEFLVLKTNNTNPRWLNQWLLTTEVTHQIEAGCEGAKMPRADWEHVASIEMPAPNEEEQVRILVALDRETTRIDTLIEKSKLSIDLLKERRSALITAAVTGQIDLREAV
ncbi:restriction endonuclease subunit S [Candidatus Symbiobacter mobilis]|uniref:Type I restriction enzyme subunit S n=1 Tax=Candidatus Symbiobacter mobilis CR TaxID=946483 RepID=U5N7Q0_9BURK|nr:restriction endonuclease subunit S [Candidatus Symbiobacter mobilis]AGX87397.1 type I restriction enzyme subunit S [Candidatus Symbiobacter mobilis CR]